MNDEQGERWLRDGRTRVDEIRARTSAALRGKK